MRRQISIRKTIEMDQSIAIMQQRYPEASASKAIELICAEWKYLIQTIKFGDDIIRLAMDLEEVKKRLTALEKMNYGE